MLSYQLNYKPRLQFDMGDLVTVMKNILNLIINRNINLGLIRFDRRIYEIDDLIGHKIINLLKDQKYNWDTSYK